MMHLTEPVATIRRSVAMEVALRGVVKTFKGAEAAVRIHELIIRPGEFVTFVGPSGCGKTTTMRMIAGLEDPTEGEIYFAGRPVVDLSVQARNVAMVFQNYALYPHMKVSENLEYGLKKRAVPKAERAERVKWVAGLLKIDRLLDRKPRELSGGEQQRVALGRAIIRTPDVLLLDEPLSNLDAKLRTFMRVELVKLQKTIGCTTIFVTHDQLEAMTMSDRIAVINQGEIQQFATPAEVYDRPANMFVAGFIGSPPMNFLAGRLEGGADEPVFRADGLALPVPPAEAGAGRAEGGTTLGIRPEHVALAGGPGDLAGTIFLVELIGAEKYVFIDTAAGPLIARLSAEADVRAGETVPVTLNRKKVRLFSTESGLALGRAAA